MVSVRVQKGQPGGLAGVCLTSHCSGLEPLPLFSSPSGAAPLSCNVWWHLREIKYYLFLGGELSS